MLEIRDQEDLVVVAMRGAISKNDYDVLHARLVEKTRHYGTVRLYEEAMGFGVLAFLSTGVGIWHDLKYGPSIRLGKTAVVSDSAWAWLLTHLWKLIAPVWPVRPAELRFFRMEAREEAMQWIRTRSST